MEQEFGASGVPFVDGEGAARCMRKFRAERWVAGVAGECHGNQIGIRTTRAEALDVLRHSLPPGWVSKPDGSKVRSLFSVTTKTRNGVEDFCLHVGPRLIARSPSLATIGDELESYQDLLLAATARGRCFVHAGVVGTAAGAIILPGVSRAGKTTLTKAFIEAGAQFFSDDLAVLDAGGFVHPYPRPLSLRAGPGDVRLRRRAEELGGVVATEPMPVAMVLFTNHEAGTPFAPKEVAPAQAVFELLQHTLTARSQPRACLEALAKVSRSALLLKGTRGEASECVRTSLVRHSAGKRHAA
jgi:hypothetical protein